MSKNILDEVQIKAIYSAWMSGDSKRELARQFEVSARTIGRVIEKYVAKVGAETEKKVRQEKAKSEPKSPVAQKMIGSYSFITVVDKDGQVYTADSSHPQFDKAYELVKTGDAEKINSVIDLLNTERALSTYSKGNIKIAGKQVLYRNIVLDATITRRIVREMHNNRPFEHLVNFLEKLMDNPSRDAVYQLFGFLEHNDIEIVEDGDFIAWKRVNDNYKDFATGRFDNSPGTVVSMPRNQVDEDKNRTCSAGLHAAAASYIPHYHGGQGRILKMKINPRDVVAIPTDYDNAKMRVCEYLSLGDATEEFTSKYPS